MPVVSVVIPAYNAAKWIGEAVASVQRQTLADWECVVVDDASTDGTSAVTEALNDSRIRVITHPVNRGVAAARNTGIRAARGKYIQVLDADDLIEADKVRHQARFLDEHPDVGIVYGDIRYFDDGKPTELREGPYRDEGTMFKLSGGRDVFLPALIDQNSLPITAALIRRRVFDEVGLHDESLRSHVDYDWCLRAAMADAQIAYLHAANAMYLARRRESNLTLDPKTMAWSHYVVRRRLDRILTGDLAAANRRQYARTLRGVAAVLADEGRQLAATWYLLRAIRFTPSTRERGRTLKRATAALVGLWPRGNRTTPRPR